MKSILKTITALAFSALAVLFLTPEAKAQVLASETFNEYTTGVSIVGGNGGTGWGTNWNASDVSHGYLTATRNNSVVTNSELTYPNYTSSQGNYENLASGFGGAQTETIARGLDTSAGGTFGSAGLASGGLISANNASLWGSFLYSSDTSGNTGNTTLTFTLNGGGTHTVTLSQPLANNFVVFEINYGANRSSDTMTIWTNPNLSSYSSFLASTNNTTAAGNYSFNVFNITTTYNGGSGSQSSIDDIVFGKTLTDVTGLSAPVPETSTYVYLLMSIGLAALVYFRRQNQLV